MEWGGVTASAEGAITLISRQQGHGHAQKPSYASHGNAEQSQWQQPAG